MAKNAGPWVEERMGRPLERILLISMGSRGDCQPYLAVALALQEAGYVVMYGSCKDQEAFVRSHGVPFHPTFCNAEEESRTDELVVRARNEGDAAIFFKAIAKAEEKLVRPHIENFKALLDEFKPDLLVAGTLCEYFTLLVDLRLGIPVIPFYLNGNSLMQDPKRMLWGLPSLPFGLNRWFVLTFFFPMIYKSWMANEEHVHKTFGFRVLDLVPSAPCFDAALNPPTPRLIGQGPIMEKVYYDHLSYHHNNHCVGTPVISKEAQLQKAIRDDGGFGDEASIGKIKDFLARTGRPVYMGWGSLTCKTPEYMLRLILESLRLSGLQAIISSGWAGLSLDLLRETKDASLVKYAAANVLFVREAPHEWLFPQCSCIVHHGGAGTTVAALRAKVPSIITPVFMDQFDHAYLINELGVGVGLRHFQKLKAEEISDALTKCTSNASVALRAKEVGEVMLAERATERVVQEVKDFWHDWVQTGRYVAARRRFLAKCQASGGCCKFF